MLVKAHVNRTVAGLCRRDVTAIEVPVIIAILAEISRFK